MNKMSGGLFKKTNQDLRLFCTSLSNTAKLISLYFGQKFRKYF